MFATRTRFRQVWYLLGGLAILFCIGLSAGVVFAGRLSDTTAGLVQRSNPQNALCPPSSQPVTIVDLAFQPPSITIYPDTTVQWTNTGSRIHTSTSDSPLWDSGPLDSGASFSFTFTTPGSYSYHCNFHPTVMTGTITVLEGCPAGGTDTPTPTDTSVPTNTPIPTNTATSTDTPISGATATPTCPPNVGMQPVSISDAAFVPDPVTVGVGTTVHWTNDSERGSPHTTTSVNNLWDSGPLEVGQSFNFTFTTPGSYDYYDAFRGFTGTIIVTPNCPPTVTPTFTATPVPTSVIHGHLTWQGVAAANYPSVTGTLTLCVSGSPQSFGINTDTSGNFTVITVLPDGVYHWQTKGGRHISSASPRDGADLTISGGQATQEFGTQNGGDALGPGNGPPDNVVNATDFNRLRNEFGQGGLKASDFDYNQVVNSLDFNILKNNFAHAGHTITCP